jgi:hypothetical protein
MCVTYHLEMSNGLATAASGLVGLAAMGALVAARARRGRPYLADGLLVAVDGPADLEPGGLPVTVAPLVTEALGARLGWDPREEWPESPAEAWHILRFLIGAAHAGGRRVRFVDVPEDPRAVRTAFWQELRRGRRAHREPAPRPTEPISP